VCGTRLVQGGARTVICEAMTNPGGHMATFTRQGFRFACGPLSFSSPKRVLSILAGLGLAGSIRFLRSHFRLLSPAMDLMISQPFNGLVSCLQQHFPKEAPGIQAFFAEIRRLNSTMSGMEEWEPRLLAGRDRQDAEERLATEHADYLACLSSYRDCSSRDFASEFVGDEQLVDLLSHRGHDERPMPALLAANMWDILCERGIWYPDCGVQGVTDLLVDRFLELGGELRLGQPVARIVCKDGRAAGVRLRSGEDMMAHAVITNADYKRTFSQMVEGASLPPDFVREISDAKVMSSDLCVSVGIKLTERELGHVQAHHVLYRGLFEDPGAWEILYHAPDFFRRRQIEICVWSLLDPSLAPPGKSVVIIRCPAPYEHFARWRVGEDRRRRPGYREYKNGLARALLLAAEDVIPGICQNALVIDVATPLSFEYYTGNHRGALAGWSWAAFQTLSPPELMAQTPIEGLYTVGHWAFSSPFLGAVPTAMHSGELVAKMILDGGW